MAEITDIIGIDEVGRGPLAGPVALCACRISADFDMRHFDGIRDSKKLSPKMRETWFGRLSQLRAAGVLDFAYVEVPAHRIDEIGIAVAIREAVAESLDTLCAAPSLDPNRSLDPNTTKIFLDGSLYAPKHFQYQETIIRGDDTVPVISAASVIAKVLRDRHMETQARAYPQYGFETHKGYGTAAHRAAIRTHGPSPIHRRSFLSRILSDLQ